MAEKLSQAQQQLMRLINNRAFAQVAGSCLAEIAVELMDAKREALHWKTSFETVRDEIKVLASVALQQLHAERLVITRKELQQIAERNVELHVGTPEPGVRIYELRSAPLDGLDDPAGLITHTLSNPPRTQ